MRTQTLSLKVVAFDLDGTLLDTAADIANAANGMLAKLGLDPLPNAQIRSFIGNGLPTLVRRALYQATGQEPSEPLFRKALAICEEHYAAGFLEQSCTFNGVQEGLACLESMGLVLCCITNKPSRFIEPLLRYTGIAQYFSLLLGGDHVRRLKPDPWPLQLACEHFEIQPFQLLMVGDSINDIEAAKAAGSLSICMSYGYSQGKDISTFGADAILDNFQDIADWILPMSRSFAPHTS